MRSLVPFLLWPMLLAGCSGAGALPPPGQTSALAPAGADPGASGVSGEAGSGTHAASPYGAGGFGASLGSPAATGPAAGAAPNSGP